ncbi:MAG: carbon-nitrogen hydrolase family protein [Phycisphaeraceae bacterium]
MDPIRVAALQYYIRPVERFEQFADQVEALVMTARDYHAHLLVFPEYFACQLLTLTNIREPIRAQIRHLADYREPIVELMSRLATESGLYIVAGTLPAMVPPDKDTVYNESYLFSPSGEFDVQGKLHMTRFEDEEWVVSPHRQLKVFDTALGRLAINICYDVEFPELARVAAREGAWLLVVPSCTDDRHGFLRVRYCAQARAIENQMYVLHACTVGSIPQVPAVSLNWGQASILSPSDFAFARDGIAAEGTPNQETMILADLDRDRIMEARETGTVLPLRDSATTAEVISSLEVVRL